MTREISSKPSERRSGSMKSELIASIIVILILFLLTVPRIIALKDYPQCIWTNDPVMCKELIKLKR